MMDVQGLLGFFTITWGEQHPILAAYLARWLGLYITILSLFALFKMDFMKAALQDLKMSPALQVFSGSFYILLGALLVAIHSLFEWEWPVLITIFGYLILIKGLFRLFFFPQEVKLFNLFDNNRPLMVAWVALWLLIGLALLWVGFIHHKV